MREYQFYVSDKTGHVLHAGVHKLGSYSIRTIRKLERKWMIWRREYVNNHAGNYPLALEASLQPCFVDVFPVNTPSQIKQFILD